MVTLVGVWTIPIGLSLYMHWWRFVLVWTLWTGYTFHMMQRARQLPLDKSTPREVYAWFFGVYRISFATAAFGYICILSNVFGITFIFGLRQTAATVGSLCLFYGLYFGVLGRDVAELCSDWMTASTIGASQATMKYYDPSRCAICNQDFREDLEGEDHVPEATFELSCKHVFHEHCIRGWALVGKKDTCPLCSEKVNMKAFSKGPWDGKGQVWAQLLDAVRYLVVWNPVIMIVLNSGLHLIGVH